MLSRPFGIRIPVEDRKTLEALAIESNQSRSAIVALAIRKLIETQKNEEPPKAA